MMPIRFPCSACGKTMRAPDGSTGKKAKCPLCGGVQVIPAEDSAGLFPPVAREQPAAAQPAAPTGAGTIDCPNCGGAMPGAASACPACGWVKGSGLSVTAGAAAEQDAPGDPGQLAVDCFKAIAYGASNFNSIFILVMCAIFLSMLLGIAYQFFAAFLFVHPAGRLILGVMSVCVYTIMGGYYQRFFLDTVIGSLEGADQAPAVPSFNISQMFVTGLKGLGVAFVYVLPIFTLPLWPLGTLAWGYSDDLRCFDVTWALRAAARRPAQLLVLWLILLIWLAVMVVALAALWFLMKMMIAAMIAAMGCFGLLIGLPIAVALITVVAVMFTTVIYRCVGMLGRHNPILTDMLPAQAGPAMTAGVIIGGVVVSVVMWAFVVPALLGG